jgi:hypothetical protein
MAGKKGTKEDGSSMDSEVLNFFVVVYNVAVSLRLGNHHKYQSASEKYKQYDMEVLKQAVLKISSVIQSQEGLKTLIL